MMKITRLFSTMIAAVIIASCGNSNAKTEQTGEKDGQNDKKVLVAYFSATGTTKAVAEKIAKATDAPLFEIEPETPYSSDDLNWRDENSRSTIEMKDKSSRPAVKSKVEDISQYDVVFVGFPVWWYTCPTIINTFLEGYDWNGKTIVPFATSGGSAIEPCVPDMEKSASGATFKDAKLLNNSSDSIIKSWVENVLK